MPAHKLIVSLVSILSISMLLTSCAPPGPPSATASAAATGSKPFVPPNPTDPGDIPQKYGYVDPSHLINTGLLEQALEYYDSHAAQISNKSYLSVVDFSYPSWLPRFFVIDMSSGGVVAVHVAHGSGSDPNNTGYATQFSNVPGSNASSLGFYLTAEQYTGEYGLSVRLDGLSTTNSNVRDREVVLHGWQYVYDQDVQEGLSWGCLAIPLDQRDDLVNKLYGGSLILAGVEN